MPLVNQADLSLIWAQSQITGFVKHLLIFVCKALCPPTIYLSILIGIFFKQGPYLWKHLLEFLQKLFRLSSDRILPAHPASSRGGSMISGNMVHIYKGVGAHFADFISFFLNIP